MADKVILRNDTAANWQSANPILSEGEMGIVTDGAKGYKIGDGVTHWNDLPYPANPSNIVQTTGNNETATMSQKGITEAITAITPIVISETNYEQMKLDGTLNENRFYFVYEEKQV